jgi:hypothetical protein
VKNVKEKERLNVLYVMVQEEKSVDTVIVMEKVIVLLVMDQEHMKMKSALIVEEVVKSPVNIVMVREVENVVHVMGQETENVDIVMVDK